MQENDCTTGKRGEIMNLSDLERNSYMLRGSSAKRGYLRWWHSFLGAHVETGEVRTFFVEFFVINPGLGCDQPILGQHPYFKRRGRKPSYVMINAGVFPDENGDGRQLHAFYPLTSLQTTGSPLVMQGNDSSAGNFFYSEDRIMGRMNVTPLQARHRSLMTDAGSMEWDVKVNKTISCHTGILGGRLIQALNLLDHYWHGEGVRSFFQGYVLLDGVRYEVTPECSYGYADKHWGRSLNIPWFQLACGKLFSGCTDSILRHSALAVNSFYPHFLWFTLRRRFLLQLTYMGEDFEFKHCKWEVIETGNRLIWHMLAHNRTAVLKLSVSCKKENLLNLRYESPDGQMPKPPLQAGADGIGTAKLYRKTPDGRELLDTFRLQNALCFYHPSPKDRT